jgi:hypothetical protein
VFAAQDTSAPQPAAQPAAQSAPAERTIRSISVRGSQRLEPETIRAYANLQPGQTYTAATLDQALKDLYATQLFADVTITGAETGDLVITVRENPVINRIILEGNKRLKDDKITPEIKLAPRQIFTRSAARADVERILELYRRQGRFAARVEPKKTVKIMIASRKFAAGPARTTRKRCHTGRSWNARSRSSGGICSRSPGSLAGPMSPTNFTYPPSGTQATFQRVPCLSVHPKSSCPKPMEKVSAGMPNRRATR